MNRTLSTCVCVWLAMAWAVSAEVVVKSEQLNPADPAWKFKTIPGPSKSDLAAGAKVTLAGNQFEPTGGDGSVLVNGRLPGDSLDLSEEALLTNANANGGNLVIDLGRVQPIAAVTSYSWHEWDVDQGSRGPQVYTLYGSAADDPDPSNLAGWTKLAEVDTRPNTIGTKWNGQHGVFITDTSGKLGEFRRLLFALQRTRSPLQPNPNLTGTLFAEIDVHSAATLARAGDAVVARPVAVEDVWVVFKTHLDIGYTDRVDAVLNKYRVNMMEGALKVVEASRDLPPEKRFSWTLAGWPLAHVLGPQQDPARRARIEQAVREGAIAFHALPFTLHTESDDLEDLVRGLGFSSQLARGFDRPLPISGKMTDVPCHSWVWPTLLSHAGVKFLQLGCNGTSAFVRVPPLFWWEGPDGSRILCNYTIDYGSGLRPPRNWPCKNYLAMVMTGDNHGPPTAAEVDNLRQQAAKSLPGVRVHFGTLDDFARAVLAENPELPVVRADMPDTWIHGWLSMPIEAKAAHNLRPLEPALDMLDRQLRAWGLSTGNLAPALAEAYEQSDLFSEHTFGPFGPNGGSWNSRTPRYIYGEEWKAAYARGAYKKYEEAFDDKRAYARNADQIVHRELAARLDLLARSVKADGPRIVVYNALPWSRSGLVDVPGKPGRLLLAGDVPAGGYKTFRMDQAEQPAPVAGDPPTALDTQFFKIVFDLKRGGIASLIERQTGRELVDKASPYALGQFLHERFDNQQMLAFHNAYGRPGYNWPKGNLPKDAAYAALTPPAWTVTVQRTASADIATLTAADTLGLAKGIAIVITSPRQQPSIDVEWRVTDKTADPLPEGGWLCFPVALAQPQFLLGRLGGPIDPAKDIVAGANRHYFCLSTGLTVSGSDGAGVGLCPIDSPCVSLGEPGLWKFSLDYTPKKPAVFVNLYNNMWNTNFPEWQGGSWSSRVRLWPTAKGSDTAAALIVPAWEARLPLLAAVAEGEAGRLPPQAAGLRLSRSGVLVTAFGHNPDGAGTLLRLWEQSGQSGDCTVQLPAGMSPTAVQPVDLRGQPGGAPVSVKDGLFTVTLKPFAPASFLLP
ncbi:MAG: glycosyl hydrolase-related protein [Tepidisphaerales bacterium]